MSENDRAQTDIHGNADPAKDSGWIVDTPWRGNGMCVFHATEQGSLTYAEALKAKRIQLLEKEIASLKALVLKAEFVKGNEIALDLSPYLVSDQNKTIDEEQPVINARLG